MTVALVPFSLIYLMRFAAGEADGNKCTYEVTEVRAIDVVALSVSSPWRGASHRASEVSEIGRSLRAVTMIRSAVRWRQL